MSHLVVTGASGFVGQFVAEFVAKGGFGPGMTLAALRGSIDIRDREGVGAFLSGRPIAGVVHLAAQSFVPESFQDPRSTLEINLLGTLNLLEALASVGYKGPVLYVGTADAYAPADADALPISEHHALWPANPYAVSKVAAEALCYQWSLTSSMRIILARPFNHIGPAQSERFVVAKFAKQIAEMKLGLRPAVLRTGNIDVTRDFTDVRDVVGAYAALLKKGQSGEAYNVCSGREMSIREIILMMLDLAGVSAAIEADPDLVRPTDAPRCCGTFSKLNSLCGWAPQIPLRQSLHETISYWEKKITND